MIIDLPDKKIKKHPEDWHIIWCLFPRIIENKLVWLSRVERRRTHTAERYDGATGNTYRYSCWEYRLIEWVGPI